MIMRIVIIVAIQTLLLFTMIGMKQYTLNTGTPILLETQPIDPRSLFRGDYVRLNYTISNLALDDLQGDKQFKRHDTIYVHLTPGEKYWEAKGIYHEKPKILESDVVIQGEVRRVRTTRWNRETREQEKINNISIRYGIEHYFVPEGEGRPLERRSIGTVDIKVAVDKFGNAGIKAILVNDEERYVERLL